MTKFLSTTKILPESELAERKANARSLKDFFKDNYHKWDTGQFRMSVAIEVLRKGRNDGLSDEETRLWPNDHIHALRVKEIIPTIDQMKDIANQNGKLRSGFMVELLKWAKVGEKNEKAFYQYFCKQYKERSGRYDVPGWPAVSQERKNRRDGNITDEEMVKSFEAYLTQSLKLEHLNDVDENTHIFPISANAI